MSKWTCVALCSFIFCSISYGQDQYEYRVQVFTTEDGLPTNEIQGIEQDSLGYLWIATRSGLVKYDGYTFETLLPEVDDSTSITSSNVWDVHIDPRGKMWAVTESLSEYDLATEQFYHYPQPGIREYTNREEGDLVFLSYMTSSRHNPEVLWIGLREFPRGERGGVLRYDAKKNTVTDNYTTEHGLGSNKAVLVLIDKENTLWVGTEEGGMFGGSSTLSKFDEATGMFKQYSIHPDSSLGLSYTSDIIQDRVGFLWMTSAYNGVIRFDPKSESFKVYTIDIPGRPYGILEDIDGILWVTTSSGLYTLDRDSDSFVHFNHVDSFSGRGIIEDDLGIIWAASSLGLIKIEKWKNPFTIYQHDSQSPERSLLSSSIQSVHEDSSGRILISTSGNILHAIEPQTKTVSKHRQVENLDGFSNYNSFFKDKEGTVWAGGCVMMVRLNYRDLDNPTVFHHNSEDPHSLGRGCVNAPFEDQAGNLWVPLWGAGLDLFDRDKGTFTHYTKDSHGLGNSGLLKVYEAPSEPGILWIGTEAGLSRFDVAREEFKNYHINVFERTMMMFEDGENRFWVATAGNGLHLFNRDTEQIERTYTAKDGLSNNTIYSMYGDGLDNLWLSTQHGISKFNPDTEVFTVLTKEDGLPSDTFHEFPHFQNSKGLLYYGTQNGLAVFHPDSLREVDPIPDVILTGLSLNDQVVEIGERSVLSKSMAYTSEVDLVYAQNDVTIDYVALNGIDPGRTIYRYILEGYDENWVYNGTQRSARYTNLSSGTYTFKAAVKNGNSDWGETSVQLTIHPPWWRTVWAFIVYGLLFVVGVVGVNRFQRNRIVARERLRAEREKAQAIEATNDELERALKHLTETQDQLIHTEKMASLGQLTAGIAHEIKNPLNFVNNFSRLSGEVVEDLKDWIEEKGGMDDPDVKDMIDTLSMNASKINEHGQRADGIIRSMLEHSRIGRGERQSTDLNKLVEEYLNLAYHGVRAREEGFEVNLQREYDESIGKVEIYPQEIGRVLLNLFDNAFYAVKESEVRRQKSGGSTAESQTSFGLRTSDFGPEVRVSTAQLEGFVEVRIADNGPGIPQELRAKIFEPFFTTKPTGSGTGLGLSLSHDIVVKGHGGEFFVESEVGEGSVFVVRVPGN